MFCNHSNMKLEKMNIYKSITEQKLHAEMHRLCAKEGMTRAGFSNNDNDDEDDEELLFHEGESDMQGDEVSKKENIPFLKKITNDITAAAEQDVLDPVVGRTTEIERVCQILSRRKKNNPILIGEPGVGKSAIVEGLAKRIINNEVPPSLMGKRILSLDMSALIAGTKYRGQFEERIQFLLKELKNHKEIILFIDEIHTIIGAGSAAGTMDAANMLKPALARGEVQCIGATTLNEYRNSIEKDGALERRFQKIIVPQTSAEETLQILFNLRERYEDYHHVKFTDDALRLCVKLSDRYITERSFPDKAIDVMDEAGSRTQASVTPVPDDINMLEQEYAEANQKKLDSIKNSNYEMASYYREQSLSLLKLIQEKKDIWQKELSMRNMQVDDAKIAEVVGMMTGIPVSRIAQEEGVRLKGMKQALNGLIIGQQPAVDKVVRAIQRSRIGLKDPNRPIGTFMFLGPTGVGKTLLAKQLAEFMFGSAEALIRIDMSEYMEKFNVSRLVGAPPGYVGFEEGGQLTEKVRRRPYSIVLLDEIEKAHGDVFNLLLQVMDEGRLTDSNGRIVDFRNTVIIMTSNVGSRQLSEFGNGIGFNTTSQLSATQSDGIIQKALRKLFTPEFLNRLDEVITFTSLDSAAIQEIICIELKKLIDRVAELGYTLQITDNARYFLAKKGYNPQMGARPLRRSIQTYLEDELSNLIINDEPSAGSQILADLDENNDKLTLSVTSMAESPAQGTEVVQEEVSYL